ALLERVARETTGVMQQRWKTQALQAKARQLETLLTTGQSLVAKLESDELLQTLARDARRLLQGSACALYLYDVAAGTVRFGALDAPDAPGLPTEDHPATLSFAAAALRTQRQVEFSDVGTADFRSIPDLPKDATLHAA